MQDFTKRARVLARKCMDSDGLVDEVQYNNLIKNESIDVQIASHGYPVGASGEVEGLFDFAK